MDASLYRSINRFADHTAWAHSLFKLYAKDGIVVFAVLLVVVWLITRRDNDTPGVAAVIGTGVSTLVGFALVQLIGNAVARARPYTAMPNAHVLIAKSGDFSFPSDHATAVGAIAIGLLLVRRPLGWIAVALAVLLAFARVYVGAHYPGDVAAGLLLGGLAALVVRPLAIRFLIPVLDRLRPTPVGVLVAADRT